jgi:hypothetical protein
VLVLPRLRDPPISCFRRCRLSEPQQSSPARWTIPPGSHPRFISGRAVHKSGCISLMARRDTKLNQTPWPGPLRNRDNALEAFASITSVNMHRTGACTSRHFRLQKPNGSGIGVLQRPGAQQAILAFCAGCRPTAHGHDCDYRRPSTSSKSPVGVR